MLPPDATTRDRASCLLHISCQSAGFVAAANCQDSKGVRRQVSFWAVRLLYNSMHICGLRRSLSVSWTYQRAITTCPCAATDRDRSALTRRFLTVLAA